MDDYYELLQVSPTAEHHAIEVAYRRLSVEAAGDPERRALLDEAYAVLTDPARRRRYDRDRVAARAARIRATSARRKQQSSGLSGKRLAFTAIGAVVALAAIGGVLVMAMGDGDDDGGPEASPTASGEFGVPPVLGDSVLGISPEHGVQVAQEDTLSPDETRPDNGVCIQASFTAEPGITSLWFLMFFDGEMVTASPDTAWILTQDPDIEQPEGGVLCYAPAGGFELGVHEVVVQVQDPQGSQPRQVVRWSFEVTP